MLSGKTILISGGTGSFGNAVLKGFLDTSIKEVRIFSRDEKKQDDMRRSYNNDKIKFYIGDVRDISSIRGALGGVDFIFHAAALKQVPSCEFFPLEAAKTNVFGTDNLLTAAIEANVKKVICLSTDKAAYPINAMGISKALMEKVIISKARYAAEKGTIIASTRYGNVLASRGSVVPVFINQALEGRPLTITNPNMTRFLMSLEEAVNLVLFAFNNAKPGDLFIQKAPSSTINTLALAVNKMFGSNKGLKLIGTRHGEKLYETLMTTEEKIKSIDMGDYFRIPIDSRNLNYEKYFTEGVEDLSHIEPYTSHNTNILDVEEVVAKLSDIDIVNKAISSRELVQ